MAEQRQKDRRAESHSNGDSGNGGEEGQRLKARAGEQRVPYPYRVIARLLLLLRRTRALDKKFGVGMSP